MPLSGHARDLVVAHEGQRRQLEAAGIRVDHAEITPIRTTENRRWARRTMQRGPHTMELITRPRTIRRFSHSAVILGYRPQPSRLLQIGVYHRPAQPKQTRWHTHTSSLGPIILYGNADGLLNDLQDLIDLTGSNFYLDKGQTRRAIAVIATFFMDLRA